MLKGGRRLHIDPSSSEINVVDCVKVNSIPLLGITPVICCFGMPIFLEKKTKKSCIKYFINDEQEISFLESF